MKRVGWLFIVICGLTQAQLQNGVPQVATPPIGDPRLESVGAATNLADFTVYYNGNPMNMRFPARVNGQVESDGDRHADMWILFNSATGQPVNQPAVIEAVPNGVASGISALVPRQFSANWAVHAVTVSPSYDPNNLSTRIDSGAKVASSTLVVNDYRTNIFLYAPVVASGSTNPAGSSAPMQVFFNAQTVTIVPFDVGDGPFNPQIMFKFVDPTGAVQGAPQLVAAAAPGATFFSPIWEIWSVNVPTGTNVSQFKSVAQVASSGFPIKSSGIRISGPVTAVNGASVPIEGVMTYLTDSGGLFNTQKFPFDVAATPFRPARSFFISTIMAGGTTPPPPPNTTNFPLVTPTAQGNVIPLLLTNPFQVKTSGPNSTGPFVRIDQQDLDNSFLNNNPPLLPSAIEANFTSLIKAGLLTSDWAPTGTHSYQDRLSLVGRALFELVWDPEEGADQKSVTNCLSCHSQPNAGGAARALFSQSTLHPASMWGGGAEELMVTQLKAAGVPGLTNPHGSLGSFPTIRGAISGASDDHFGIQTSEKVANLLGNPGGYDAVDDPDHDGVANEQSVGETTAETVFLMSLAVPNPASPAMMNTLGVTQQSVQNGETLFRNSVDNGGVYCNSCHRVFYAFPGGTTFQVKNPQTNSALSIQVPFHTADAQDVSDGLAQTVGQPGLRLFGDVKLHKLGALDKSSGTDTIKTAEVWDAGSVYPFLRDGSAGSNLLAAILAHEGTYPSSINVTLGPQTNSSGTSTQKVTVKNLSTKTITGTANAPIRVVLTGAMTTGIQATLGATAGPDGTFRQGAYWKITSSIFPGASATVTLSFSNPAAATLQYGLAIQDNPGFSEAVASIQAFKLLTIAQQTDITNFLRAQLINDQIAEH